MTNTWTAPTWPVTFNPTWAYQDRDVVLSAVKDIMSWKSGKLQDYDPSMMNKVWQTLNLVSDYANGVPQEDIDYKYNSVPDYIKDGAKMQSHGVSANGSMTNFQLKSQAEEYGYNLSDSELQLLQKRPWIQSQYLNVKKASMIWDSDQIEALMANALNDIHTWVLQHKWQLKVRLQNILHIDNADDVDYLAEDLRWDLTCNMTDGEKMQRIRNKYSELFWFKDRTWWQKAKETTVWLLNGAKNAVVNWLHWLSEATSDVALEASYGLWKIYWADENPEWRVPWDVALWGINENALSPDTKEAVEYLKAYGLWTWAYDVLKVYYQAKEESNDASLDKFYDKFADFWYSGALDMGMGETETKQLEENSNYYWVWEFVWASIPEIYLTSKIWELTAINQTTLSNMPRRTRTAVNILNRIGTSALEWVAFSAMESDPENSNEIDKWSVGLYTAIWTIVWPTTDVIRNSISKRAVKKRMGKQAFKNASEKVMRAMEKQWVNISRSKWEKIVADIVLEWSMGGTKKTAGLVTAWNPLDKWSEYMEWFLTDLQKSIVSDVSKISEKNENAYIHDMLSKIFKQSKDDVAEAYSSLRIKRIWAWSTEEEVAKEREMMEKLYKEWADKFTLEEQEIIKRDMRTIHDTYSKSKSGKPLGWMESQRWRDQQVSAQNIIKSEAEKYWIENLSDRFLQESVLISAKEWFDSFATTSMKDIINRYAWRTLVWWLGAYVASQTVWEWPLSNPYIATATTLLVMSAWGSPRASLLMGKIAKNLSATEAYSIINNANKWSLAKLSKWNADEFMKAYQWVIYSDTIDWFVNEMEDNTPTVNQYSSEDEDYHLKEMWKEKHGRY